MGFDIGNPFFSAPGVNSPLDNDPLKKKDDMTSVFGPKAAPGVQGPQSAPQPDSVGEIGAGTAGSVFSTQNPNKVQTPQDIHADLGKKTENLGAGIVSDAKASTGNMLGSTQGKAPDRDQKPAVTTSVSNFDANGQPKTTTSNGVERAFGDRANASETKNEDGSIDRKSTLMGKDGKPISMSAEHVAADGSSSMSSHTNNKDGSTTDAAAKYDTKGQLVSETTETKGKDGKMISATDKKSVGEGKFEVQSKDDKGNVSTEIRDENDKVLSRKNSETGKMEDVKESHKAGSLGDIKQQKADMEAKKKEEVTAKLEDPKSKSDASQKYQKLDGKAKEIDAKIAKLDPVKDKDKIADLQKKQGEIKSKQSDMVQKITDKSLAKDDKYQKLNEKESKEQAFVDKYKDFNLTDKDGKKLSAEDISDRKDELFKDGKALDRTALKEKGVDAKYSTKAILADPMKVFTDENASKEEKDKALMAVVLGGANGAGGAQQPQGPQQSNGLKIANAVGDAFAKFAVGMAGGAQGTQPQQGSGLLQLASQRKR